MDNQHRKITGYRELDEVEIALMNKIKELGPLIEDVLLEVAQHIADNRQLDTADGLFALRMDNATPERFLALAKTDIQTGLMYATRAVAQPEFF